MAEFKVGDFVLIDKSKIGKIIYIISEKSAAGIEFKELDGVYTYSVFPMSQLELIS